jgi:hypothetical protein
MSTACRSTGKRKSLRGSVCLYHARHSRIGWSGPPDHPILLYDYDPSRSQRVPIRLLEGFRGYLLTDGYETVSAELPQATSVDEIEALLPVPNDSEDSAQVS